MSWSNSPCPRAAPVESGESAVPRVGELQRRALRLRGLSEDPRPASELVHRRAVLELTYTAHDMVPFAHDIGHVDDHGEVLTPFRWDAERRLSLRAKLDALYFHLYGVTDRDDIRYVYSTFPIVERDEKAAYGAYRSRDLCLAWTSALGAGQPDAEINS